mmetsp:Transcript_31384/g.56864  ORF Transcript_31384/g.56864 Transcript_31384/m.56864 type:complete len:130 (+) Transcript_31384:121-510(+)
MANPNSYPSKALSVRTSCKLGLSKLNRARVLHLQCLPCGRLVDGCVNARSLSDLHCSRGWHGMSWKKTLTEDRSRPQPWENYCCYHLNLRMHSASAVEKWSLKRKSVIRENDCGISCSTADRRKASMEP